MAILKSARNGLLIGITSDTVGVIPRFSNGEDNRAVFGSISNRAKHEASRNPEPERLSLISSTTDVSSSPKPELNPNDNVILNDGGKPDEDNKDDELLPSPSPAPDQTKTGGRKGRSNKKKTQPANPKPADEESAETVDGQDGVPTEGDLA